jgi:hypothetical protein
MATAEAYYHTDQAVLDHQSHRLSSTVGSRYQSRPHREIMDLQHVDEGSQL